ncbi:MAG: hypothetical protein KF702_03540 [Gammaproteobacteria bacterium]|nr:hypothetical protein [Gammaproteobacteria bacterium]
MNIKSFAMLVTSGWLAISSVYIAPAMADDTSDDSTSIQQSAPSSDDTQNNNSNQNNDNANTAPDDSTLDTATGDDY